MPLRQLGDGRGQHVDRHRGARRVLLRVHRRLSRREVTVTLDAFVPVFIGGLVACYWAGLKFGVVVRILKNLGTSA